MGVKDILKEKLLSSDIKRVRQHPKFQKANVQTKNGSIFSWTLAIPGGEGTSWEGLVYDVEIRFSRRHPFEPPRVDFPRTRRNVSNPGHPLVDGSGRLRMQKLSFDKWLPTIEATTVIGWLFHLFETEPPSVTSGNRCPFTHLSSETVLQVLSFVGAGDLGRLSQTSTHMLALCFDEATWAKLYYRSCTSLDGLLGDKEGGACPVRVMGVSGKWYWRGAREAYIRSWEMRRECKGGAFSTSRTQELHARWELGGLLTVSAALMTDIKSRQLSPIAMLNRGQIRHMEYLLDSQTMKIASLQRLLSWPGVCRSLLDERDSDRSMSGTDGRNSRIIQPSWREGHARVVGGFGAGSIVPRHYREPVAHRSFAPTLSMSPPPSKVASRLEKSCENSVSRESRFTAKQRTALGLLCGNLAAFPLAPRSTSPPRPAVPGARVRRAVERRARSVENDRCPTEEYADAMTACPHHHLGSKIICLPDLIFRTELPSRSWWRTAPLDEAVGDDDMNPDFIPEDLDLNLNGILGGAGSGAGASVGASAGPGGDEATEEGSGCANLLNAQPACSTGGVYWPTLYDITTAKLRQKDRLRECFRRFTLGQKLDVRDPSGVWLGAVVLWAPKSGASARWEDSVAVGDDVHGPVVGAGAGAGTGAGAGVVAVAPPVALANAMTGDPEMPMWRRLVQLALFADGGHLGRVHLNQRLLAGRQGIGPAAKNVPFRGGLEAAGLPNAGEWVITGPTDGAQNFLSSAVSHAAATPPGRATKREPTEPDWPPPPQVPLATEEDAAPGNHVGINPSVAADTGSETDGQIENPVGTKSVLIHYMGHKSRYDEWIATHSPRLAPFRSRTSRPLSLTMQSVERVVLRASPGRLSEEVQAPNCVDISLSCPWISHYAGGGVVTYHLPTATLLSSVLADFCHLGGISLRRATIFRARMNLAADIRNGSCEVEELDDGRTLEHYKIGSGAVLHVAVAPAPEDLCTPCPSCARRSPSSFRIPFRDWVNRRGIGGRQGTELGGDDVMEDEMDSGDLELDGDGDGL